MFTALRAEQIRFRATFAQREEEREEERAEHEPVRDRRVRRLSAREAAALGALVVALVVLGLYPQPASDVVAPVFAGVEPTQLAAPGGSP